MMKVTDAQAAGWVPDPQAGPFRPCRACGTSTYHNMLARGRRLIFACRECGTLTDSSEVEVRETLARKVAARVE